MMKPKARRKDYSMPRTVSIGRQDFASIITNGYFYVDKTNFIKEWWENGDSVTLITRPRRFGKTLNMSMVKRGKTSSPSSKCITSPPKKHHGSGGTRP